jgi:cytochrome c-type biogenesis protein CcsB
MFAYEANHRRFFGRTLGMASLSFVTGALCLYLISMCCYLGFLANVKWRMLTKIAPALLIAGFVVHVFSLFVHYLASGYTPITNMQESLSFFGLCLAGFFIFLRRVYKIEALGAIFLPIISVFLVSSLAMPAGSHQLPPVLRSFWLPIHTVFAFLGNAVFLAGCLVSIVYIIIERSIKKKRAGLWANHFPSLETLDRINYKCMSYGFPFLTLGIVTGSLWAELAWGSYWNWDPKETWSLVTWIVYAILIHNRLAIGWRGRKTAYLMIVGFACVLFTFIGVNFFIKSLHSYV